MGFNDSKEQAPRGFINPYILVICIYLEVGISW